MWERVMKMKIEIRNDTAVVSGYVNAVGRDSRPITDKDGKLFIEQIEPGAFRASLERSENVDLLLNHNKSKVYASTKDGSLKLTEDSIGLRAEAVLSDADMIRKARSGEFRGWSFGMYVGDSTKEERAEGIPRRHVKSLNMFEVSLIDKSRIPCYVGTSVECRAEGEDVLAELRYSEEEPEIIEEERSEPEPVDYSAVDDVISELRYGAVDNVIAELRYNPYHDPSNGRFCSGGGGGGGGVLVVEKGQKGKGYYVVDVDHDEEYEKWKAAKEGGVSAADKAIREATGGVIQKDEYTVVDAVMTRKNSKAAAVFDKTVLSADVDSNGNVVLKYAKGEYSGNYGDKVQDVQYKIKAGFVDDTPVNMDLSKATSISGANTYALRDVAKEAGLTWNSSSNSYIRKNHPLNTKTKFTSAELNAMSDSEIDAIHKAVFYKASIGKGHSLTAIDAKAKYPSHGSRAEKIALIEKWNSLKPGQDYRIRAF